MAGPKVINFQHWGQFMVRKTFCVLVMGFVALFAFGGAASAQPAAAYPPPPVTNIFITININITIINNGTLIIITGGGFDSLEGILLSAVNTSAPVGLRSSSTLSGMAANELTTSADSAGAFVQDVSKIVNAVGVWELTATGTTSGKTAKGTVTVLAEGSTLPAKVGSSTTYGTGGSSASSALASTGASVAGPIAIGAAALFAGLAMLFFGTRGVIRRKGSRPGGTV